MTDLVRTYEEPDLYWRYPPGWKGPKKMVEHVVLIDPLTYSAVLWESGRGFIHVCGTVLDDYLFAMRGWKLKEVKDETVSVHTSDD